VDLIPKKLGSGLLKYSLARSLSLRTKLSPHSVQSPKFPALTRPLIDSLDFSGQSSPNEHRVLKDLFREISGVCYGKGPGCCVVQSLRDRHNCDHENWQYVRGEHRCEERYHTLPPYISECRQCHIQACNRCRRNRL